MKCTNNLLNLHTIEESVPFHVRCVALSPKNLPRSRSRPVAGHGVGNGWFYSRAMGTYSTAIKRNGETLGFTELFFGFRRRLFFCSDSYLIVAKSSNTPLEASLDIKLGFGWLKFIFLTKSNYISFMNFLRIDLFLFSPAGPAR